MDLTKRFSHERFVRAWESWAWVGIDGLGPRFTLLFGDGIQDRR